MEISEEEKGSASGESQPCIGDMKMDDDDVSGETPEETLVR